ncbi:hypothetical protein [Desulfobulbus alkaliphilus]|uniref:hypothetical protein n=1 Tax=Desulfobulbus alkaliphilus TaxID=869814 RepID=UPI001962D008|nr:hypothetical protein [Desulfobulbus alkaliphilus]MBM9536597.1 hypothetical protein [Desulfobulbus alkaliphilus]
MRIASTFSRKPDFFLAVLDVATGKTLGKKKKVKKIKQNHVNEKKASSQENNDRLES